MKVDIDKVLKLQARRRKINSCDLRDIVFYKNGKKLDIDPEVIDGWEFIGLNNTDFIDCGEYKRKVKK